MKKTLFYLFLMLIGTCLTILNACSSLNEIVNINGSCNNPPEPFQLKYKWGPYINDGDKMQIEKDIKKYLNTVFPSSNCPPPPLNPNNTAQPYTKETQRCSDLSPSGGSYASECKYYEFIVNNSSMSATEFTGCKLKEIIDEGIIPKLKSHIPVCCWVGNKKLKSSIVPTEFIVECLSAAKGANPPVKRGIYINTTYRCCVNCGI